MPVPTGTFDTSALNLGWFGADAQDKGWFDEDFLDTSSTPPPQRHLALLFAGIAGAIAIIGSGAEVIAPVSHDLNEYRSPPAATANGHSVRLYSKTLLVRQEQQPRTPDHGALFAFRSAQTQVSTQPIWLWPRGARPELQDPQVSQPQAQNLHAFRVGYQTVGQPWHELFAPYKARAVDGEEIRHKSADIYPYRQFSQQITTSQPLWNWNEPPVPIDIGEPIRQPKSELFPYRQFAAAIASSQPFWLWNTRSQTPDALEVITRQSADSLHAFRTIYQTVGQPWQIWRKPQHIDGEAEIIGPRSSDLYQFRQFASAAATYQPLWLAYAYKGPPDPYEQIRQPFHDLNPFRWPSVVADGHVTQRHTQVRITCAEPFVSPYDHASRLFFGKAVVVAQPAQPYWIWQAPQKPEAEFERIASRAADIFQFRKFQQTLSQSYSLYVAAARVLPDAETIAQPNGEVLHRYRVGYQTVGQPFSLWPQPKTTIELERISAVSQGLFEFRQFPQPVLPGQPWHLWKPVLGEPTPEEWMHREFHDASLYPFRPHDALPPFIPPTTDVASGGWVFTRPTRDVREALERQQRHDRDDRDQQRRDIREAERQRDDLERALRKARDDYESLRIQQARISSDRAEEHALTIQIAALLIEQRMAELAAFQADIDYAEMCAITAIMLEL